MTRAVLGEEGVPLPRRAEREMRVRRVQVIMLQPAIIHGATRWPAGDSLGTGRGEQITIMRLPYADARRGRDRLLSCLERAERTILITDRHGERFLRRCALPAALLARVRVMGHGPGTELPHVTGPEDPRLLARLADELREQRLHAAEAIAGRAARPPRIAFVAPPFSGHLHPMLGIARALQRHGCEVLVCSAIDRRDEVERDGLRFLPLMPGREAQVQALVSADHRGLAALARLPREARRAARLSIELVAELTSAMRGFEPDAIVADMTLPFAGAVAERLGCLWITSHPSPCAIETPDGPPACCGGLAPDPSIRGRVRDAAMRTAVRAVKGAVFHSARPLLRQGGITSMWRADGSERLYSPSRILCLGDRELEFARRWPRAVRFTGPVLHTPRSTIDRFGAAVPLRRGNRPLVLCTFGTHLEHAKGALPDLMDRVAEASPEADIVLAMGGMPLTREPRRDGPAARIVPYLDYGRLAEADLIVHHGGAGITWATLAAGSRQIVLPMDYDQFDFAERLTRRGLAERAHEPRELPELVRRTLASPDPAAGERIRWRERIRAADGAGRAAAQILTDLGRPLFPSLDAELRAEPGRARGGMRLKEWGFRKETSAVGEIAKSRA